MFFMKKRKKNQDPKPKPFEIGDLVLTPVSDRWGKIVKIGEARYGEPCGLIPAPKIKVFIVEIWLPNLRQDGDTKATLELCDYQMKHWRESE